VLIKQQKRQQQLLLLGFNCYCCRRLKSLTFCTLRDARRYKMQAKLCKQAEEVSSVVMGKGKGE